MIKSGRALRLGRLFKGDETPLFLVPLDHTVTDGPFTDARGYDALLGILADNGADAIVVHKGRLRLLPRSVYARLAVVVHLSASTRYAADPTFKYQVAEVEDCLRRGADAVSVHVNVGSLTEDRQLRDARGPDERRDARGPRLVVQEAVDAFHHEPFLPAPDAGLRLAGPAHDLVGANTVGAREDDRRPPSVFLRGITVPGDRFKSAADGPRDRDGNSGAHAPDSHGNRNRGIPIRTFLSGKDH